MSPSGRAYSFRRFFSRGPPVLRPVSVSPIAREPTKTTACTNVVHGHKAGTAWNMSRRSSHAARDHHHRRRAHDRARSHHRVPRLPESLRGDPRPRPRRHPRGGGDARRQARLRGGRHLYLRSRRPRAAQTADRGVPRSPRAVPVLAPRPPRPRQLHGSDRAHGEDRRGAALRRARERRARRAPRPHRTDADAGPPPQRPRPATPAPPRQRRAAGVGTRPCGPPPRYAILSDDLTRSRGVTMRHRLTAAIALTLVPTAALAHPGLGDAHGFVQGFAHPLGGLDHVLAMVTVGIFAWQLGGRALWLVPASFVLA